MKNKLSVGDVINYENASRMILQSPDADKLEIAVYSPIIRQFAMFCGNDATKCDNIWDELRVLSGNFDYARACSALNELSINREQLGLCEKVMGLEDLTVSSIIPEGHRAFIPLATMCGIMPEVNRLYLLASPSMALTNVAKQQQYLSSRLHVKIEFLTFADEHKKVAHLVTRNVGEPFADVYFLLQQPESYFAKHESSS